MARHALHRRPLRHRPEHWVPLLAVTVAAMVIGSAVIVIKEGPALAAQVNPSIPSLRWVPGAPEEPIWPTVGQGAVAVTGVASLAASPAQVPVPIGSITKIMTAVVVLNDYPLDLTALGPSIMITESDVAEWRSELTLNQSNVRIEVGEVLTERHLLDGLLVHSGNNFAHLLGRFDAGTEKAFVEKMNAQAKAWGLNQTHYADPSGFDPATTSTAADQVVLGRKILRYPLIAAIVKQQSVEIPTAGMQMSYTPLVGVDGVVGIKSGLTTESGGCDLLALDAMVDGHPIQVIAAVLGQRGPNRLMDSGMIAYELARDRVAQFATLSVATTGSSIGSFGWTGHEAALHVTSDAIIPAWPGGVVRAHLKLSHQRTTRTVGGTVVGWLILRAGPITTRTPVATSQTVQPPTLLERLI